MRQVRSAFGAIDKFFFEEVSPASLAVFRIFLGLLVLVTALLMVPDLFTLFGPEAVVPVNLVQWWYGTPHFSVLWMLPDSKEAVVATWLVLVWASVALTFGWHTRISALTVLLCLCSFHHRNPFAVHSGDTLLRLFSFLLIFSCAGAMYSLDAQGKPLKRKVAIWAQRLIQLQLAGMYCQAFFAKVIGPNWQDGTALYWILKLEDYARFPVPIIPDHLWMLQVCSWATLWIEFSLWTLIWVPQIRYYVLGLGVMLHLGIEYSMNIPVFEWITMAAYITFVDPKHVEQFVASISEKARNIARLGRPATAAIKPKEAEALVGSGAGRR